MWAKERAAPGEAMDSPVRDLGHRRTRSPRAVAGWMTSTAGHAAVRGPGVAGAGLLVNDSGGRPAGIRSRAGPLQRAFVRCRRCVLQYSIKDGAGHKPGSVEDSHSSRTGVTARLQRPTREPRGPRDRSPIWPCSGWGLPCRRVLPPTRCALTAPFHPYHSGEWRSALCCTFRRLAPPRRYLAPCPVEPGLSSPAEAGATVWPTPARSLPPRGADRAMPARG